MSQKFQLSEHVTIITGSAQGFGLEFAQRLLSHGAQVCISDINQDLGNQTLKSLQDTYGQDQVIFHQCDVTKKEDWQALWTHAEQYFDRQVTLLVNNAGVGPEFNWKLCLDIMLYGMAEGTFLAIEKMSIAKGGKGGRIMNIASMAGLLEGMRNIEESGYTMAKWAIVALTRSFAQRGRNGPMKRDGIKAMALCPWFANTQLVRNSTSIESLESKTKIRCLKVSEVGDCFVEALKLDKSGACYTVFPDAPMVDYPNPNFYLIFPMLFAGRKILKPLGFKSFGMTEFLLLGGLLLMLILLPMLYIFG